MTPDRTGDIGNCYYYDLTGRRLADTDRRTITGMVNDSRGCPGSYCQYVGTNGYITWAYNGEEIPAPRFAADGRTRPAA